MRYQTEMAVQEADIVILMVDAKIGITPDDMDLCRWLRRKKATSSLVQINAKVMPRERHLRGF